MDEQQQRHRAIVTRLCKGQNFGFAKMFDGRVGEIFLHRNRCGWFYDLLKLGDVVEFGLDSEDPRGAEAVDIELVAQAPNERLSGRITELREHVGFGMFGKTVAFFSFTDVEADPKALVKGQTVTARLIRQPGRSNARGVEVRPEE